MYKITLDSNDFHDESPSELQYALFRDLNDIEGVSVVHLSAQPADGERGALGGLGFVLKSVAPGAVTSVANAVVTRLSIEPEIDLELNELKLSTRNLDAAEFKSILAEALRK